MSLSPNNVEHSLPTNYASDSVNGNSGGGDLELFDETLSSIGSDGTFESGSIKEPSDIHEVDSSVTVDAADESCIL